MENLDADWVARYTKTNSLNTLAQDYHLTT